MHHFAYRRGVSHKNVLHAEEVDLSDLAGRGVFVAWEDPAVFSQVKLGSHGAIEWPGDLDLCPDALYLRLTVRIDGPG